MTHEEQIIAYQEIVTYLKSSPNGKSCQEIMNHLREHFGLDDSSLAKRTIERYIQKIRERLEIDIKYDKALKTYTYNGKKSSGFNSIKKWVERSYALTCDLAHHKSLADRIILEPMPSSRFLNHILIEMESNHIIEITYQEYGSKVQQEIMIEPYFMKTYHNRWYLVGRVDNGDYNIYCLDRVKNVKVTDVGFEYDTSMTAERFFRDRFGIRMDEQKTEKVVLRAFGKQRYLLHNQPINISQKIITKTVDYWDYEISLKPTYDFVSYLESLGRYVEVLEPRWLREELVRVHTEAIERNKIS